MTGFWSSETMRSRLVDEQLVAPDPDAFRDERLADIAVFGVKLATVCNERLPSADVDLT